MVEAASFEAQGLRFRVGVRIIVQEGLWADKYPKHGW